MESLLVEFIEIDYAECSDKLLNHSNEVSLFYSDGQYIHQIKNSDDFLLVVAKQLKAYQQYTRG